MSTNSSKKRFAHGNDQRLSTLIEVSRIFSSTVPTREVFKQLIEIMKLRDGIVHGDVFLLDAEGRDIRVEMSSGEFVEHKLGEIVASKVVETGKPTVIPQVSREAMFADAATRGEFQKNDVSYIGVPLITSGNIVGALGAGLRFSPQLNYESEVECLSLIAAMMAPAIRAQRLIDEQRWHLKDPNSHLPEQHTGHYDFPNIVGCTGGMGQVFEQIAQVAPTNATVLIRGESGTGKDLIAREIHNHSERSKGPFVKVNCAALPESLIESELFGYEQGAFTGAHARKQGRFEVAEGGTLFLDELGDLNLSGQAKLLRVLQERKVDRLGGTASIPINVRLITATNKDLEKAMAKGRFREDLYYRLNVFTIVVPSLRDRMSDLPLLAGHFMQRHAREHQKEIRRISDTALAMLSAYHWPGNVRELENVLERAVLVCDSNVLHSHHLPPALQVKATHSGMAVSLGDAVASYEKDILIDALQSTRGNRTMAAALLRSTERVVNYKIRKYEIDVDRFRT